MNKREQEHRRSVGNEDSSLECGNGGKAIAMGRRGGRQLIGDRKGKEREKKKKRRRRRKKEIKIEQKRRREGEMKLSVTFQAWRTREREEKHSSSISKSIGGVQE